MSRRRRGKKTKPPILAFAIVVIAGLALYFLISSGSFSGENSSCGSSREKDPEKSGYCLTSKDDYDELAIVVGNTQNAPEPNLDFTQGELHDVIYGVFYKTERGDSPSIYIISASGSNRRIDYKDKYRVKQNISASNNELRKLGEELNFAIKSLPTEPGADYIGGILEAKGHLKNAKNPLILVVGSGYNDSGALNFAKNDILQNKDSALDILVQNRRVRENILDGIAIQWYDIGYVSAPQSNLDDYKTDIQEIYQDTLSYLGADKIEFGLTRNRLSESVKSPYTVRQVYVKELKAGDIFNVTENIGEFQPGNSILKTPRAQLEDDLRSFASHFNPNAQLKLEVTGYTYVGPGGGCPTDGQLALSRAEVIKDILIGLGVPSGKIETFGANGAPTENASYTCDNILPESEQRTVKIKVVKE